MAVSLESQAVGEVDAQRTWLVLRITIDGCSSKIASRGLGQRRRRGYGIGLEMDLGGGKGRGGCRSVSREVGRMGEVYVGVGVGSRIVAVEFRGGVYTSGLSSLTMTLFVLLVLKSAGQERLGSLPGAHGRRKFGVEPGSSTGPSGGQGSDD